MGLDTDAYFWFGVANADDKDEDDGLPERVVEKMTASGYEFEDAYELADVVDELIADYGCGLVRHCSSDYPMYSIAIKSTVAYAWRGNPVKVERVEESPEWVPQLMKAAEAIGWPVGEVGWFLASSMS